VCYPPAVQVVESFKNISEVESHLLLRQVAPAHDVVQETSLLCPENRNTWCIRPFGSSFKQRGVTATTWKHHSCTYISCTSTWLLAVSYVSSSLTRLGWSRAWRSRTSCSTCSRSSSFLLMCFAATVRLLPLWSHRLVTENRPLGSRN